MTKYDYLTKLKHYLQPLPIKERNAAMKYYEKYFNDAGPENERYVILNLGSPKQLAEKILSKNRHTIAGMVYETKKNVNRVQKINKEKKDKGSYWVNVLSVPFLFIAIILIVFILLILAAFAVAILVAILVAGIALICMAIPYINGLFSVSMFSMGIGLVLISIPVFLFLPTINFAVSIMKKSVFYSFRLFNKQLEGKAAAKK